MPALPARISFIQAPFRRAVVEDSAVRARHGRLARESDDPVETFFHHVEDARGAAVERQALLGVERRRFSARAIGVDEALALDYTAGALPVARFIDRQRSADRVAVVTSITIDLATQQAEFGVWG